MKVSLVNCGRGDFKGGSAKGRWYLVHGINEQDTEEEIKTQPWNTHDKSRICLFDRKFYPSWKDSRDSKETFRINKPTPAKFYSATSCEISMADVVCSFELRDWKIPLKIICHHKLK